MVDPMRAGMQEAYVFNVINIFCKWTCCLQSNQVKGTSQDYIYELIMNGTCVDKWDIVDIVDTYCC